MKWSRLFWICVLSGGVLIGGAAWLSAQWLSAPGEAREEEGQATAELGSTRSGNRARQPRREPARPWDTPALAAGDRTTPSSSPSGAEAQPSVAPEADAPKAAAAPAPEAGEVAELPPSVRSKGAPRVNPTSGELMWSARDVIPDGGRPDEPLCGGKECKPGQFCCGPPECGRCAYPMAGPRCPSVCPGQKSK